MLLLLSFRLSMLLPLVLYGDVVAFGVVVAVVVDVGVCSVPVI